MVEENIRAFFAPIKSPPEEYIIYPKLWQGTDQVVQIGGRWDEFKILMQFKNRFVCYAKS